MLCLSRLSVNLVLVRENLRENCLALNVLGDSKQKNPIVIVDV